MKKPVRFPAIADADMTEEQRRVAASIMSGRKSLSGPFNAMLRSPTIADPLQQIGAYIRFTSPISQRLKEFAIVMVARFWNAEFEWHVHRGLAEEAGLTSAKADCILRGYAPDDMDDDEAEIYRFVASLLRTGHATDESFDGMKQRFGEKGVTEFIVLVGYYCTVSFLLNVDRHPSPDGAAPMPRLHQSPFSDAR
ncbi:4-carboxymuconolactone decarboxylase [Nitrobacteraceae bacterium AZCC 2161]